MDSTLAGGDEKSRGRAADIVWALANQRDFLIADGNFLNPKNNARSTMAPHLGGNAEKEGIRARFSVLHHKDTGNGIE
jgi:hypothetical protein